MTTTGEETTSVPERELVLTRVIDAPRELVFRAWTDGDRIGEWFGPKGFTCRTHAFDLKVGGLWRFDLIAPDGKLYDNRVEYLEIDAPRRLVFDHGSDLDDDPGRFRVTITFEEQSNGKTVITLRQLHPTRSQRDAGLDFGAVELGLQTMDRLAERVERLHPGTVAEDALGGGLGEVEL